MERSEITAAVVEEVERMLAEGVDHAEIASRVGISRYVLGILAREPRRRSGTRRPAPRRSGQRVRNPQRSVDATTVRRIQRMLEAGALTHVEIAREAGVSKNTVSDVATGKRRAVTLARPLLSDGETFLPDPVRCSVCRAMISVVPCRACGAMREKKLV